MYDILQSLKEQGKDIRICDKDILLLYYKLLANTEHTAPLPAAPSTERCLQSGPTDVVG